jgi:hypothetical protein
MTAKASICLLALLLSAACNNQPTSAPTAAEAIRVTNLYLAANSPQTRPGDYAIETEDLGDRWRVTYRLAEGGTGGISTFEVDKSSARIVREEGEQ